MNKWLRRYRNVVCLSVSVNFCVGCSKFIDQPPSTDAVAEAVSLETDSADDWTTWQGSGDTFIVPRPPPFPILAKLRDTVDVDALVDGAPIPPEPADMPDGLWEQFEPVWEKLIANHSEELDVRLRVPMSDLESQDAFDVSVDGDWIGVLHDSSITIHRSDHGEVARKIALPDSLAKTDKRFHWFRFGQTENDLIVASDNSIALIDGDTGEVVAEQDNLGRGSVRQWEVSADHTRMLIYTSVGAVWLGATDLSDFVASDQLRRESSPPFSMAQDGSRIACMVGRTPRTYELDGSEIVTTKKRQAFQSNGEPVIATGIFSEIFCADDSLIITNEWTNEETGESGIEQFQYPMLWTPKKLLPTVAELFNPSNLMVAERVYHGETDYLLLDYENIRQQHGPPTVLPALPANMRCDEYAKTVALLIGNELSVAKRQPFGMLGRSSGLFQLTRDLAAAGDIDSLQYLYDFLLSQRCRVGSELPGIAAAKVTTAIAQQLSNLDPDLPSAVDLTDQQRSRYKKFDDWAKSGAPLALTASAERHASIASKLAYNRRQARDLSPDIVRRFEQAKLECDAVLQTDDPPLLAMEERMIVGIRLKEPLEKQDALLARYVQRFPESIALPVNIMSYLRTSYYGDVGDGLTFLKDVALMLKGKHAAQHYTRIISNKADYMMKWRGETVGIDHDLVAEGLRHWDSFNNNQQKAMWRLRGFFQRGSGGPKFIDSPIIQAVVDTQLRCHPGLPPGMGSAWDKIGDPTFEDDLRRARNGLPNSPSNPAD